MFDMEIPQAVKEIIPGHQPSYSSSINSTGATLTSNTSSSVAPQPTDDFDFYEFFNTLPEKSTKSLMEYARNHVLGMLEVEPLHFTCHSTSDGTKMERLDSLSNGTSTAVLNPFGPPGSGTGTMSGTINFHEPLPPGLLTNLYSVMHSSSMPYSFITLDGYKNYQSASHKIMNITQMLNEVNKNILPSGQPSVPSGSSELMPSTPKTTPQVMTPPLTPPNEAWQQVSLDL